MINSNNEYCSFVIYSKFDIHVMQYCLVINMQRNQDTFCEAINHIVGQSPKTFCLHLKALNNYFMLPAQATSDIGKPFITTYYLLKHWKTMQLKFIILQFRLKKWKRLGMYWSQKQTNSSWTNSK